MSSSPILQRSVAAVFASMLVGGVAHAQQPAPTPGGTQQQALEEVVVTGSRIRRDGMETPTPVTAVNIDELSAISPGNLIESINWMPQFLGNSSPADVGAVGGAAGASFLNLRGIGDNRTLVLLNGRRAPGSNRLGRPDINTFPEAMIRGMEVVTGGASAAYGSDAVSGVVNFLLDTEFTGIAGHLQGGVTDRGDGENWEASFSGGTALGDRAHLIFSIDHYNASAVETVDNRGWYQGWGLVDVNGPGQPRVVLPDVRSRVYTAGGLIRAPGSDLHMIHFVEGGVPVAFVDGDVVGATTQSGGTGWWGEYGNKYQDRTGQGSLYPRTTRGNVFGHLTFDFSDDWTGFLQIMAGQNKVDFVGTGGAHQEGNAWQATIFRDNAFLPQSIAEVMDREGRESFNLSRFASSADFDQARVVQDNDTETYTVGFEGDANEWRINGYYQYGRSDSVFTARRFSRLDRLYRAVDAVVHPETGAVVCRSTLTFPDDGCAPANMFGPGSASPEAIEYVLGTEMYRASKLQQHFTEFAVDGQVHEGWGAGPISVAAGASYRQDSFLQQPGPEPLASQRVPTAESQGYRGLPNFFVGNELLQFSSITPGSMGGHFDVWEVFAETLLPLFEGRPGAESVDLSLAARYADYSGSGGVIAWKAGIDWRLTNELRLRATRSRDTRAATLAERFDRSTGGATATDPVTGTTYSFDTITGGNPEVDPELGDTWTVGFVYQPEFLSGFGMSVDWYDVKIKDFIATYGVQNILNDCAAGAQALCERIVRNPDTNVIRTVENVFLNVAQARVQGVDIEASYRTPVTLLGGDEDMSLRVFASYLSENSLTNQGAPTQERAGTTNLPEWTTTATLGYGNGPVRLSLTGRYIDSRVVANEPIPVPQQRDINKVASVFYTNARLSYLVDTTNRGSYDFYLNVVNLFDRDPPMVANWSDFFGAQYFPPGIHDTLGRRYTAGVRIRFD